jgi:hypothetical protein
MPNPPKTTSQILQEARALVAQGWCQGPYTTVRAGQRCYCTVGALLEVLNGEVRSDQQMDSRLFSLVQWRSFRALTEAARRLSLGYQGAIAYNEAPGRSQEEVLALFDEALTEVTK